MLLSLQFPKLVQAHSEEVNGLDGEDSGIEIVMFADCHSYESNMFCHFVSLSFN